MSEKNEGNDQPENQTPAVIKAKDLAVQVQLMRADLEDLKKDLEKTKKERDQANAIIADDIRARLIPEITKRSIMTREDVDEYSLDKLQETLEVLKTSKTGFKPVSDFESHRKHIATSLDEIYYSTQWGKKERV